MKSLDPNRWSRSPLPAAALALALVASSGGCKGLSLGRPAPPTQSDRLMQAYPELQSGRFLVIADFENPAHMELFHLISTSPEAKCVLNKKRGRTDTGKGCLQFTAGASADTIVVSNSGAENWYLKRDWRPYDLLLMSVHASAPKRRSEQRALTLEVAIAAGAADELVSVQSSIPLQREWNVIRLDLAEVGERIPIDDVREIRLSVSGLERPVDLRFDDILLTGHREDLFGDSSNRDGGLYVQRIGRRWKIGAGGRFELTFANGQIVEWYSLSADPYRLRNLVEGTILGPSPMVLGSAEMQEAGFAKLGKAVVVRERIVEMNAVRAVVACDWWFVDDPDLPLDDRPFQRWLYTIYPTGQIYVAVACTAATEHWSPRQLGLAVTVASTPDNERRICQAGEHDRPEDEPKPAIHAILRNRQADAFLLYTLGKPHDTAAMAEIADPQQRHVSFVAAAPHCDETTEAWVCHMLLARANDISEEEAAARAAGYSQPPGLQLALGSLANADHERPAVNGFHQEAGCYVITPDQGRVRFVIGSPEQPCFSPAFTILGSGQKEAWVYVNHLIFNQVARDPAGNLVFQLPQTLVEPTMVEVLLHGP